MRVLVAPANFKDALGPAAAAEAIARGLRAALPSVALDLAPMADGGEGTVEAVLLATPGERIRSRVADPLGRPIEATWALVEGGRVAVIEMAAASGLERLARAERDPLRTSTRGTGDLLRDAAARGARRILLGIGGSATVDGGAGALAALGFRFLGGDGREVDPAGGRLASIARIEPPAARPLAGIEVVVLCDVENRLLGPRGAAPVYGPQKGADEAGVRALEAGLAHLAGLYAAAFGRRVEDLPGSGAAGGLGAGLVAALGAELVPGFATIARLVGLERRVREADLVLGGEGRIDRTSASGKVLAGLGGLARVAGRPLVALAGALGEGHEAILEAGVTACFAIGSGPATLDEALARTAGDLERTAAMVARTFACAAGPSCGGGSVTPVPA